MTEDTLFQTLEEIEKNPPCASARTTDNLEIRQVDKTIGNTHKIKSTHT